MTKHALTRTSPKGSTFSGTCMKCGREGLTLDDLAIERCENVAGMSDDDALLNAITGSRKDTDNG